MGVKGPDTGGRERRFGRKERKANEVEIRQASEGHLFICSETVLQGRVDRFGRLLVTLPMPKEDNELLG